MTIPEVSDLILKITTLIGVLWGIYQSVKNGSSIKVVSDKVATSDQVDEVHKSVNGTVDKLVSAAKSASFAEGEKSNQDKVDSASIASTAHIVQSKY